MVRSSAESEAGKIARLGLTHSAQETLGAGRKEWLRHESRVQCIAGHVDPKAVRYRDRSNIERFNGRLKDEFFGRHFRVRGTTKVTYHLMWGILALKVNQFFRLGKAASPVKRARSRRLPEPDARQQCAKIPGTLPCLASGMLTIKI